MINKRNKIILIIVLSILAFFSVKRTLFFMAFEKFNADWIITKVSKKGINIINQVSAGNMTFYTRNNKVSPFSFEFDHVIWYKAKYFKKKGKKYVQIFDHKYFSGTFEIGCLDKLCCEMYMKNEEYYMEFIYNTETYGIRGRPKCPIPVWE